MGISCSENALKNPKNTKNCLIEDNEITHHKRHSVFRDSLKSREDIKNIIDSYKDKKQEIEVNNNNYDTNLILEEIESDIQKLNDLMEKDECEYKTFQEYYYLVEKDWIENFINNKNKSQLKVKHNISNGISYPIDFQIINKKILNKLISKKSQWYINSHLIFLLKGYIIIKDIDKRTKKNIFFVCQLNEDLIYFNVDFIFSFLTEQENEIYYDQIKKIIIEEKRFVNKNKNIPINFYDEKKGKIGFYICFPINEGIKINIKSLSYYNLNEIYLKFLHLINNNQVNYNGEINGCKNLSLNYNVKLIIPVFILRKNNLEYILKEIFFDEYNIYKNENNSFPKNHDINKNIQKNENLIRALNDIELSSQECINESESIICLINEEFYTALKKNFKIKKIIFYYLLMKTIGYILEKKKKY